MLPLPLYLPNPLSSPADCWFRFQYLQSSVSQDLKIEPEMVWNMCAFMFGSDLLTWCFTKFVFIFWCTWVVPLGFYLFPCLKQFSGVNVACYIHHDRLSHNEHNTLQVSCTSTASSKSFVMHWYTEGKRKTILSKSFTSSWCQKFLLSLQRTIYARNAVTTRLLSPVIW